MARVATSQLGLGTWLDNENPGAGSQSIVSTGANGNMIILDIAVGTEHNADGTHKANKIDKGNLKTTVADGTTIEKDATVGLRVKDGGITAAKLAASSIPVGGSQVQAKAIAASMLADGCIDVGGLKIAAGALKTADYGALSITAAAIAANTITSDKMEYKTLRGYLNQASTGDPVLTIVKNTLGYTPTVSRTGVGVYNLISGGGFGGYANKCFHMISGLAENAGIASTKWGTEIITIRTKNLSGAAADSLLSDVGILIEVYP